MLLDNNHIGKKGHLMTCDNLYNPSGGKILELYYKTTPGHLSSKKGHVNVDIYTTNATVSSSIWHKSKTPAILAMNNKIKSDPTGNVPYNIHQIVTQYPQPKHKMKIQGNWNYITDISFNLYQYTLYHT